MKVRRKVTRKLRVWRETGEVRIPEIGECYSRNGRNWVGMADGHCGVPVSAIVAMTTEEVTTTEDVECPEWIADHAIALVQRLAAWDHDGYESRKAAEAGEAQRLYDAHAAHVAGGGK